MTDLSLPAPDKRDPTTHRISLGLQGGGVYGAFTWGVLDRLLDDERIAFDAISGTSAGTINAVVMADGMAAGGGRQGARDALHRFWSGLSNASRLGPVQRTPLDYLLGRWTLETSPGYHMMQMISTVLGPLHAMPIVDPVRLLLSGLINFERVRSCTDVRLFIHATNVRTGKGKLCTHEEMDVDRLMAAICLPQAMAAVEIDGEAYWDGSYLGNPALVQLAAPGGARDVVIVQINPVARQEIPRSIADINSRANEIAFNISLMREIAAITRLGDVVDDMTGDAVQGAALRMHMISGTDCLSAYSLSSKYNTDWSFISRLHEMGFAAANCWLDGNVDQLGVRSTIDTQPLYDPEVAPSSTVGNARPGPARAHR